MVSWPWRSAPKADLGFVSISPLSPAGLNPRAMPWSSQGVLATKHRKLRPEASDNVSIVREGFGGLFPLAVTQWHQQMSGPKGGSLAGIQLCSALGSP